MVEDQNLFLTQIKKLKLYIVKFDKNDAIKIKEYPIDCIVGGNKH